MFYKDCVIRCHCGQILQKFAWQSINFRQKPKIYHTDLSCHTEHSLCHTELSQESEVSISLKYGFFALC